MCRYIFIAIALVFSMTRTASAIEEPKFETVHKYADFEVRDYSSYLVAETVVASDFNEAGNEGFHLLFDYISGKNSAAQSITMTAPVIQSGQKIEMTAPVIQSGKPGGFVVQFVMPASFTLKTLPVPSDSRVKTREVPAARVAVIRYSGFWTQSSFESHLRMLMAGIEHEHLTAIGSPIWARYDPPFMPWFLRRNEILVPIAR